MKPRFIGTETEYGIVCPQDKSLSPIVTSTHAVVGYAAMHTSARARWDFAEEHPLRDSRGFDLKRYSTVPVVDPNAMGVANVVTPNGARFYVDHAHPEYSSPECATAWEAMVYDAAGTVISRQAMDAVAQLYEQETSVLSGHEPCPPLSFYKNNVDGKGASYGSHENYLYSRDTDFDLLAQSLIPFFVTRQVVTGAGRVGLGPDGDEPGFQISQRADYIEQEISLETTLNRGIINTRDEPHAESSRFGRLHVIVGDANLSQTSNLLKLGMTSLVMDAIEEGVDFSDLKLADPVGDIKRVSRDLTLTVPLQLKDGRSLTALEILAAYRSRICEDDADQRILSAWDEVVGILAGNPLEAAHLLDWVAKYRLVKGYLDRGVAPTDPRLGVIDIQYTDLNPHKSLYEALTRKGQMRQLVDAQTVATAAAIPPTSSRAYFRGRVAERFGDNVFASNWQNVTLRVGNRFAVFRLNEVDALTQPAVVSALDEARGVEDLLARLAGAGIEPEYSL
ncbi:proteasomal accessory factor [Corynebacterium phocae]|uniref:Proteasomal accessory factor n=1 Tax=Corynebacterium phocae TaxID=161895 RepID=A0A1L7D6H7_9CORY|nr:proteasomal accessory factor [Corynebacterium phocae]